MGGKLVKLPAASTEARDALADILDEIVKDPDPCQGWAIFTWSQKGTFCDWRNDPGSGVIDKAIPGTIAHMITSALTLQELCDVAAEVE